MFYYPGMLVTPFTRFTGDNLHGRHPVLTPVWVRLDALCLRVPGAPHEVVPDGIDMTGEAAGHVHGWFRTGLGDWLGVVNYHLRHADPHAAGIHVTDQLVPRYALRPRGGDAPP